MEPALRGSNLGEIDMEIAEAAGKRSLAARIVAACQCRSAPLLFAYK
jgi:hypothetical protein